MYKGTVYYAKLFPYKLSYTCWSSTANSLLVTQLAHFGYRIADVEKMSYNYKEYSLVSFVNTLFYYPVLGLVKTSMILLYLRLGGTKRGVQIGCYVLLIIISAHTVGTSVADIFQCLPVQYSWDRIAMDQAAQVSQPLRATSISPLFWNLKGANCLRDTQCPL